MTLWGSSLLCQQVASYKIRSLFGYLIPEVLNCMKDTFNFNPGLKYRYRNIHWTNMSDIAKCWHFFAVYILNAYRKKNTLQKSTEAHENTCSAVTLLRMNPWKPFFKLCKIAHNCEKWTLSKDSLRLTLRVRSSSMSTEKCSCSNRSRILTVSMSVPGRLFIIPPNS